MARRSRIDCFIGRSRGRAYIAMALGCATAALIGCSEKDTKRGFEQPYHHLVRAAYFEIEEHYSVHRSFSGKISSPQRTDLAFDRSAHIVDVMVDVGDPVILGQPLAKLDSSDIETKMSVAESEVAEAEAELRQIENDLDRQQSLLKKGISPQSVVDRLNGDRSVLAAKVQTKKAQLSLIKQQFEKSFLRAPYDGVISARFVDQGEMQHDGAPVVRVLQDKPYELHVAVPVEVAESLEAGQKGNIRAGKLVGIGTVRAKSAEVDFQTNTVLIKFSILGDHPRSKLMDGQNAYVELELKRDAIGAWVPVGSLNGGLNGAWNLLILQKRGSDALDYDTYDLVRRIVTVEHIDSRRAFVVGDFTEREQFVHKGLQRLAAGQIVRTQKVP